MEKQISMLRAEPHTTSQLSRFAHTPRLTRDSAHNQHNDGNEVTACIIPLLVGPPSRGKHGLPGEGERQVMADNDVHIMMLT